MKKMNPAYVAQIARGVNACNYFQLISMRLEDLFWGKSRLTIATAEKHLQPYGIVHGGVCASIIDAACFWAAFTQAPEKAGLTTIDLKLNYLAPVVSGDLTAIGECMKIGRTIGLGNASVYNADGDMVAHGASTLMVLPGFELEGGSPTVPKYLEE